jgi:helix-turn-helix, Psq domain
MSSEKENQEGRVQLAIKALNDGVVDTVRTAARHYEVPRETLHRRMRGTLPRADKTPNRQKLSVQEEEVLKEWVLDLDSRGYAPRCEHVGKRAQILLAERFKSTLLSPGAIG